MKKLLLLTLIGAGIFCAYAQDNAAEDEYISAGEDSGITVYEKQPGDPAAPERSVYGGRNTVTRDRIKEQGSKDLLDALRDVPGVTYSKRNSIGGDTGTSLYIRGRGASHPSVETITNFDGVPRNGSIYGQSMPDAFSLGIADSINIYKAPQPSAFGAGYALVDVQPRFMKNEGWEADAGVSPGSFLTVSELASFGYKKSFTGHAFDAFAAQSWQSTKGHTEHSAAYQQSYYFNGGWSYNAWNVRYLVNYVDSKSERPLQEGQSETAILPSFVTRSLLNTLTANHKYSKAEGYVKAYCNNTNFRWLDENPAVPGDYSVQYLNTFGARAKETLHLWPGGEVIAGSDFDWTLSENLDHNETAQSVRSRFPDMFLFSPYIAASHTLGGPEGWHIAGQAGVRGFVHNVWADAAAPQFGITGGYKGTDVYANYVLGYVYPAPANIQSLVNSGGVRDADLKSVRPEVVYHYEAGISRKFGIATLGGSFFFDDGRNRIIANDIIPKNASLVSYFRITGVEIYGNVKPVRVLTFFAGGTWLRAAARGEDGIVADRMPFTPDISLASGVTWTLSCFAVKYLEDVMISADYRFLHGLYANTALQFSSGFINSGDTSKLDDQHIVHIRASYTYQAQVYHIDSLEAYIDVDNLLNQKYEYWPGYRMPGITVSGGLNIKLK